MGIKKIMIYILMLIGILAFILIITRIFMLSKNKMDEIKDENPMNTALSAMQYSNKNEVQSAVTTYLSKIKAANMNKYTPVITAGSINKGSAYAMLGSKKYIIDADSIGITLPKGNWSIDIKGTVTGP